MGWETTGVSTGKPRLPTVGREVVGPKREIRLNHEDWERVDALMMVWFGPQPHHHAGAATLRRIILAGLDTSEMMLR